MTVLNFGYDPQAAQKAAEGGGMTLLPTGKYVVTVVKHEVKPPSQPKGHPQLELTCEIKRSPDMQNLGRTHKRWLSLSPKAIPYFVEPFLKAAGIPYQMQNGQISFDDSHLLGATTEVTCRHEEDQQGNLRDRFYEDTPVAGQPQQGYASQPSQPSMPQAGGSPQFGAPPAQMPPFQGQGQSQPQPQPQQQMPQSGWQPPVGQPPQQPQQSQQPQAGWQPPGQQLNQAPPGPGQGQGWPPQGQGWPPQGQG